MKNLLILFLLSLAQLVSAEVTLDEIFKDNLVLQRNQPNAIFGKATTEKKVTIIFKEKTYTEEVKNGQWKVQLDPSKMGGPFNMVIKGDNKISIKDILIGDVWICSGQSNMYRSLEDLIKKYPEVVNSQIEGYSNDKIRFFRVKKAASDSPLRYNVHQETSGDEWSKINPENSPSCSATAYFFARKIYEEMGVPIGLIISAYGATEAESWTPSYVLKQTEELQYILDEYQADVKNFPTRNAAYKTDLAAWKVRIKNAKKGELSKKDKKKPEEPMGLNHPKRPSALYNAMIEPLTQISNTGVIWYQGEGNGNHIQEVLHYQELFTAMIQSWRKAWGKELPFYYVQLAAFRKVQTDIKDSAWAWLREEQTATLALPNTGMAVITDVGTKKDIHPPYKKEAGERLALQALANVYKKDILANSPSYKKHTLKKKKIIIVFQDVGKGLKTKSVNLDGTKVDKSELKGFIICGSDQKWKYAHAKIIGKNKVAVCHPEIPNPMNVRFAWANFPICNLYNEVDLPAIPFRTDNYEFVE